MFGWPQKSRSTSCLTCDRGYWWLDLTDFCNFFISFIFFSVSLGYHIHYLRPHRQFPQVRVEPEVDLDFWGYPNMVYLCETAKNKFLDLEYVGYEEISKIYKSIISTLEHLRNRKLTWIFWSDSRNLRRGAKPGRRRYQSSAPP